MSERERERCTLVTYMVGPLSWVVGVCGGVRPCSVCPMPPQRTANSSGPPATMKFRCGGHPPGRSPYYSVHYWDSWGVQRSRPPLGPHCVTSPGLGSGYLYGPLRTTALRPDSSAWRRKTKKGRFVRSFCRERERERRKFNSAMLLCTTASRVGAVTLAIDVGESPDGYDWPMLR